MGVFLSFSLCVYVQLITIDFMSLVKKMKCFWFDSHYIKDLQWINIQPPLLFRLLYYAIEAVTVDILPSVAELLKVF